MRSSIPRQTPESEPHLLTTPLQPVPMNPDVIATLILRELRAMRREIESYPDDASLWREAPGITNPGGTLAVHCAGNLRHFVGAVIGKDGYVRDRDAEFSMRGSSRERVIEQLDAAAAAVERALGGLPAGALDGPYPVLVHDRTLRADMLLTHMAVHLGYHLGQLDYHRRMVTGDNRTVNALALAELPAIP